ncbi:MAG: SpoIIE family protein phosphatase [Proteobacteria bacterium]|nr:SpoIIE family protein phosphatase [Pseudomonadota bacterium]
MTVPIEIKNYPVFEKGTFRNHPTLFDRFILHASSYMMEKFNKARTILEECEETITWPLISGPGFSGATHPGADTILIETMYAAHRSVYNSDCLYINPRMRVFAVSDPPGKTVSSRRLFRKLDRHLSDGAPDGLEPFINQLSRDTEYHDAATLSLVHFPQPASADSPPEAVVYIAGDTIVFHGNSSRKTLRSIDGNPHFIGTTHASFQPHPIELEKGDFIVIASDGILPLATKNNGESLEQILLNHLEEGPVPFVANVVQRSNEYYEQPVGDNGTIPRLGGNDNLSVLVVYPDDLMATDDPESFLLGGYLSDG